MRRDRPGAANAGRKVMALLFAMVLSADSIDDRAVLRAGRTRRLLGGWLPAPSTLGTFLRAFTFESVRLLRRRPGAVTILVPIERLRGEPGLRDALCVLEEHEGGFPDMTCGSFQNIFAGRARTTLPLADLVPDGAIAVRIRVIGGKTIEAPVNDNY